VPRAKKSVAASASFIRRLAAFAWLVLGVVACGQAPAPPAATSRLIDTPPISKLRPDQLHGLATRCGRYTADGTGRGPYDARYCEAAIAAWSDSPIQMLRLSDQPAASR